jgi:hypothetical protein
MLLLGFLPPPPPIIICAPTSYGNSPALFLLLVSNLDCLYVFWASQLRQIIACGVKAWLILLFPEPLKYVKIACVKRGLFKYFPLFFWAIRLQKSLLVVQNVDYFLFS